MISLCFDHDGSQDICKGPSSFACVVHTYQGCSVHLLREAFERIQLRNRLERIL
jgi:hypothetical protein